MNGKKIVLIDPQNDFTSDSGVYARRHQGISQIKEAKRNILQLLRAHQKETFIVVRSDYRPDQFGIRVSMCLPGTIGNSIDSDLSLDESYTCFTKTEHSAFTSKAFHQYLQNTATHTLVICGFLAEYCVQETARDALTLGYTVLLMPDCIGTGDDVQERKQHMLQRLQSEGARLINS